MGLRVLSFDYDGCLSHINYGVDKPATILSINEALFSAIRERNTDYRENIVLVGSNRQSLAIDLTGHVQNENGSCFLQLEQVAKVLGARLDKFLLADIYGDLPAGTSFDKAMDTYLNGASKLELSEHASFELDVSKVNIIYAQLHKIACDFPGEEVAYYFYDDKLTKHHKTNPNASSPCLLLKLHAFFSTYPELIPPQFTLHFCHYKGARVDMLPAIYAPSGNFIDANFAETVKEMTQKTPANDKGILKVVKHITPADLTKRQPLNSTGSALADLKPTRQKSRFFPDEKLEVALQESISSCQLL